VAEVPGSNPGAPTLARQIYDSGIGRGYGAARRTDPRIAAAIDAALGDARKVLNVGAGTGSYEPPGREVVAVDPSTVMLSQRPEGSAPAFLGSAEDLPFFDDSFDAVMAVFSDHHWSDRAAGMREVLRVARQRVVLVNMDPALTERFWLTRDYLRSFLDLVPERYLEPGHWASEFETLLGGEVDLTSVPVPHDCLDGFYQAYWRRPEAYLEPSVRDGISVFHALPDEQVSTAIKALRRDLDDGTWDAKNPELRDLTELDVGLRIVTRSP
jgi:SAM-dependent methyltransferase